ncbi:MAG TPA: type I-C CRISPR-associated protein Cas8c/Csd1 [Verrucomicrobia bacterium]|nr:MAG: type I-C CRISPR-associated protein Cas8c/Csd1 [Lentisphaerae bacterium GWF2_57_35]HBA83816.1 type I-C CRISPR-associated protein Cas8c/Csd1 [Verrucomicrobiota bacterium]
MILQALKEYYDRKAMDPEAQMAPPGFEWKEIPYIVVLNSTGNLVSLNSTYEGTGKNKRAKSYLVPQAVKKTSGIASNLLWENPEYAVGIGEPKRHDAFKKRITDLGIIGDTGVDAVKAFLERADKIELLKVFGETWKQVEETGANLSFQLVEKPFLVVESEVVKKAIQGANEKESKAEAICLATGQKDSVQRLHTSVKGVWGAQTSGANIVSFNLDAFRSFGKEKGVNAPVGKKAAFAYTTALNRLLSKDSKQRMQVGDASTVFWSAKSSLFEDEVADFFNEPPKDDPERGTRAVESLFKSVQSGALHVEEGDNLFYVLGLSPNASRIAIRFWIVDAIPNMAAKFCRHFVDTRIVHGSKEKDALSLFRLLAAIAAQGKSENIPPNLAGETMRAILEGLPYPQTLLQAAIRRIRAEHQVSYPRASLVKACLNRLARRTDSQQQEEMKVSLDIANTNIGYRLGRLFATLEKIQAEAHPGINATIRDKFYGAASSTPVTVFGNLMRLKNHHLAKLENAGRRVNFERLLGETMSGINDFPSHLKLEDQGRFAIGYYHQMQDFYTKKEKQD